MHFSFFTALVFAGVVLNADVVNDKQARAAALPLKHTQILDNRGQVLDLVNSEAAERIPVQVKGRKSGVLAQQWIVQGDGPHYTVKNMGSNTFLSYSTADTGSALAAQACGSQNASRWHITASPRGVGWNLIEPASGYALSSWSLALVSTDTAPVTLEPFNHHHEEQIFQFEEVQNSNLGLATTTPFQAMGFYAMKDY
ncbi:hypothetical protein C8F01DRAFT_1361107 [Mycena amicta]|nr:hypothetical protein C8F01DRAFT_1361107 [Mycena amicta]